MFISQPDDDIIDEGRHITELRREIYKIFNALGYYEHKPTDQVSHLELLDMMENARQRITSWRIRLSDNADELKKAEDDLEQANRELEFLRAEVDAFDGDDDLNYSPDSSAEDDDILNAGEDVVMVDQEIEQNIGEDLPAADVALIPFVPHEDIQVMTFHHECTRLVGAGGNPQIRSTHAAVYNNRTVRVLTFEDNIQVGRALWRLNYHNREENELIISRLRTLLHLITEGGGSPLFPNRPGQNAADIGFEQLKAAENRGLRYNRKPYKYRCCNMNFTRFDTMIQHQMESHLLIKFKCVFQSATAAGICQNPPSLTYKLYSDHINERHKPSTMDDDINIREAADDEDTNALRNAGHIV